MAAPDRSLQARIVTCQKPRPRLSANFVSPALRARRPTPCGHSIERHSACTGTVRFGAAAPSRALPSPIRWPSRKACGWRAASLAGALQSTSCPSAVPLSSFRTRILRLLAAHRNPESFVAGASSRARRGARYSRDIDLSHNRELATQEAADPRRATMRPLAIVALHQPRRDKTPPPAILTHARSPHTSEF